MAIGFICPCCGLDGERSETKPGETAPGVFLCSPCQTTPPPDMSVHTIPIDTPVVCLDATKAFAGLTEKEKSYARGLAKADWEGAKICLLQTSPESAPIFCLLQLVFSSQPIADLLASAAAAGLTDEEAQQAIIYCAAFYGNMGNYKSFGDTKFVPALAAERLKLFLTPAAGPTAEADRLWAECCPRMYSLPPRQRQIGLGKANGISTYFSANCEESDAALAGRFRELSSLLLPPIARNATRSSGTSSQWSRSGSPRITPGSSSLPTEFLLCCWPRPRPVRNSPSDSCCTQLDFSTPKKK